MVAFLVGLGILVVGGELVVRHASRLARSLGVSPLVLGLTIVSIGTSAPELAVGITASLEGAPALTVGNIAGTNVVNILLILGLSALLLPVILHARILRLELPMVVVASLLFTVLALDQVLSTLDGILMIGTGVAYTVILLHFARRERWDVRAEYAEAHPVETGSGAPRSVARNRLVHCALLGIGLVVTLYGADVLVQGAVAIARDLQVSEAIIGLTIVAIGTSAPEFVTSIIATIRNERDVAVGNLIGSSIYNILVILALTCIFLPGDLPVDPDLLTFDIPIMVAVAILCIPVFVTGKRVSRAEGALFVATYALYLGWIVLVRA